MEGWLPVVNAFLDSVGPYAPWLVFLLAAAESAAFLGLFIPGEAAVVFGGVLAGTGRVSLGWAAAAAVLGAIVGDSTGYYLGSRYGVRILAVERFAKIARRIDRAGAMVTERGWWALVVARFTSLLRAVVPFTAGMVRMRYRTFAIGNVTGGILWGLAFTLIGYFAGDRWPVVARWLRTGGLIILGLAVVVGGLVWITRWVSRNQDRVAGWGRRAVSAPPVRWLVPGMRGPARLLRPYVRVWPAGLATVALLWMFGGLLQDVLKQEEFFLFDAATLRYAQQHQIGSIIAVAKALVIVTQPMVVGIAAILLAAAFWRTRRTATLAILLSVGGQWVVVVLTRLLVDRASPPVAPLLTIGGYGFPSEHLAALAAVLTVALWPWR
ncbi:MAG: DedA family protein, partial [Thermoanaerobaculales bacterium]|nr:DedA family protein [Thermoanaerobaculales bacterium]